jgi:lipopolysaccharide export system protein LptC
MLCGAADRRAPPDGPIKFGDRHSRMVDLLRFLLPATALVLVALVVLWPQLTGGYQGLIVPVFRSGTVDSSDAMRMHRPRYVGRTSANAPYEVTASSAVMDPAKPDLIHLDQMIADIKAAASRDLHLSALAGTYHRQTEQLDLSGGLALATSDGYQFVTESAAVDLQRGTVTGEQPIDGQGPAGTLAAQRFQIRDGGDHLRFEGRVKVTWQPYRGAEEGS